MIKYEIKATSGEHPVPIVVFDDEGYDLLGEFLLAERSFRREILSQINEVDLNLSEKECFTGNAFTLETNKSTCKIISNINGGELVLDTADFKQILLDYIYALREIKVMEKMKSHEHHHHGHHE